MSRILTIALYMTALKLNPECYNCQNFTYRQIKWPVLYLV